MTVCLRLGWLAALALTPAVGAQTAAMTHAAWLSEILDLDITAACVGYHRIASNAQAPLLDRQLATARLIELRRLGFPTTSPAPELREIPETQRETFLQALHGSTPPPIDELLATARRGPEALEQYLGAIESALPPMRPLLHSLVPPGPPGERPRPRPHSQSWTNHGVRLLDLIRAREIVEAELDGRTKEAGDLRRRGFPTWAPAPWPADAMAALLQVEANLLQWLGERQLTQEERELLRRLQAALAGGKQANPRAALQLLDRLPVYAERLRAGLGN